MRTQQEQLTQVLNEQHAVTLRSFAVRPFYDPADAHHVVQETLRPASAAPGRDRPVPPISASLPVRGRAPRGHRQLADYGFAQQVRHRRARRAGRRRPVGQSGLVINVLRWLCADDTAGSARVFASRRLARRSRHPAGMEL